MHISNLFLLESNKLNIELPLLESTSKIAFTGIEKAYIVAELIWTILCWRAPFFQNRNLSRSRRNGRQRISDGDIEDLRFLLEIISA